jgi:hypothetical protein
VYLQHDPIIFSRVGALLVIIGVFYGVFKPFSSRLNELEKKAEGLRSNRELLMNEYSLLNTSDPYLNKRITDVVGHVEQVTQDISMVIVKIGNREAKVEGCIVIIGTFIWGFGDVLIKYYISI